MIHAVALGVGILLATGQAAVPVIFMQDQFSRPHDVRDHRGDVVMLIFGDRKSADANKALGAQLHVAFHPAAKGLPPAQARQAPVQPIPDVPAGVRSPDVLAIPVACVGDVPALVQTFIRGQIRAGSPDLPVWLDFADVMKKQYGLKPGFPNVVVLDALGRCRHAGAGAPTAQDVARLIDLIQELRREAHPAASTEGTPGVRGRMEGTPEKRPAALAH